MKLCGGLAPSRDGLPR